MRRSIYVFGRHVKGRYYRNECFYTLKDLLAYCSCLNSHCRSILDGLNVYCLGEHPGRLVGILTRDGRKFYIRRVKVSK